MITLDFVGWNYKLGIKRAQKKLKKDKWLKVYARPAYAGRQVEAAILFCLHLPLPAGRVEAKKIIAKSGTKVEKCTNVCVQNIQFSEKLLYV